MKAVLLRLLLLVPLMATNAFAASSDDKVQTAVAVIIKLCVGGGSDVTVHYSNQNQFQIDSGTANVTLERHEAQGLIDGLNNRMSAIQAEQANRVRDCIKPYIGDVVRAMLYPPNAVAEPPRSQIYAPSPLAPTLLDPAFRTNFAQEATDFGIVPTIGLNPNVNQYTPAYINGGRVISTGELEHAMRSGIPFALIDVLYSGHQPLPEAHRLPGAGMIDDRNDLGKQNWFVGQLLSITGGSYDVPVVVYCLGVSCWESFNAATRAIIGGFKNVYWYRGGIDAWYSHAAPAPRPSAMPAAPVPVTQRAPSPSWCSGATKPAERLICGSARLASLDNQLSDAYQAAKARLDGYAQQRLIRDERDWIQDRDGCGADPGCIERAYRARISELSGY